jgi:predicted RNA binding protein YcfA (HicA-like mRNA interferase family)
MGQSSREIIRKLEADGWFLVGTTGDHHHFKHPTKPGKVTVQLLIRAGCEWKKGMKEAPFC